MRVCLLTPEAVSRRYVRKQGKNTEKGKKEVEKLKDGNSLIDDELKGGEEGID